MLKQLKSASKIVLEYVKANPGKTSSEIVVGTNTHAGAVSGSLWALWVGKYITRSRSGIVGRGPKFVYFFKTDKPRYKHRSVIVQGGKTKAPVVKDDRQLELNFGPDNGVEILVAVKGIKETLALSPEQARALHASLSVLLGAK